MILILYDAKILSIYMFNRNTLDKRVAAPRMFCDICDQFDLHETEDCPRQAQDFSETIEKTSKSSKKQPVERPYCDNCESKYYLFNIQFEKKQSYLIYIYKLKKYFTHQEEYNFQLQ